MAGTLSRARGAETRISFSVAATGDAAACLVGDGVGPLTVEHWDLTGETVVCRRLEGATGASMYTQLLCVSGGRVLVTRPELRGLHRVALVTATSDGLVERPLGEVESEGFRLLATPDPTVLGVAIGGGAAGSRIWTITDEGFGQPLSVAGRLGGGTWLDSDGRRLAVAHGATARTGTVVVDMRTGAVEPLPGLAADRHLVLADPTSGLLVLAVPVEGALALGFTHAGDGPSDVRIPLVLDGLEGTVLPVAVDPSGTRVCLQVTAGARSRLYVFTPADDQLVEVPLPAGCVHGRAAWSARGLTVPFSSAAHPTGLARLTENRGRWQFERVDGTGAGPDRWAGARLARLPGPAGTTEAVVYGDEDWRGAQDIVIALHGGPAASWDLGFDPLFQSFAAAGLTVVAPNQRGSTGYGTSHRKAVHGAWGGPDLDDICHLARSLRRPGGRLLLYGVSYGAFLALVAAAAEPELWSGCVAVAPFLSGPLLYAGAGPAVRAMIEALDGLRVVPDRLGPRDLTLLGGRITAPVLVVHGTADEIIPVAHSRTFRTVMLTSGRRAGRDFAYLEVAGGSHYPIGDAGGDALARHVTRFLASGCLPRT